jgi:hypothetical protein
MTPEGLAAAAEKSAIVKTPTGESMVAPKAMPDPTIRPGDYVETIVDTFPNGKSKPAVPELKTARVAAVAEDGSVRLLGREGFIPREDVALTRRATKGEAPELPRTGKSTNAQESARSVPEIRPAVNPEPAPQVETVPQPAPPAFKPGQRVNVLTEDGKIGVRDELITEVGPDGVTINQRSTNKPVKLPFDRVAAVEKPVGQLPTTAMAEKPVSLGRNNARRGAAITGGGAPDVVDLGLTAASAAVRAGKRVPGAAIAGRVAKAIHSDPVTNLVRVGLNDAADKFHGALGMQQELLRDQQIQKSTSDLKIGLAESREAIKLVEAPKPASGSGFSNAPLADMVTGKTTPTSTLAGRLVRGMRGIASATARLAQQHQIPGMHAGTAGGKIVLHRFADDFRRLVREGKGESYDLMVDEFAKKYRTTREEMNAYFQGDLTTLMDSGDTVVSKNALESSRFLKDLETDLWLKNGERVRLLDLDPNSYGDSAAKAATGRMAFSSKFGPSMDPADILPPGATREQVEAARAAVQAFHGIDVDRSPMNAVRKTIDEVGLGKAADFAGEVGRVVSPPMLRAMLSGSGVANTVSAPFTISAAVGTKHMVKGFVRMLKDGNIGLVEKSILPQYFATLGDVTKWRAGSNLVTEVIGVLSKPLDRLNSAWTGHSALSRVEDMAKGTPNLIADSRAMLKQFGYSDDMGTRLAKGKGTPEEYRQVARRIVEAATGQGTNAATRGVLQRSKFLRATTKFVSFMDTQARSMMNQIDIVANAKSPEVRNAAMRRFLSLGMNLTVGGAAVVLTKEFLRTGNISDSKENPEEFVAKAVATGLGGTWEHSLLRAAGLTRGQPTTVGETIEAFAYPVGVTAAMARAAYDTATLQSTDPLINFMSSRAPGFSLARDHVASFYGIDTGAKPAALRTAMSRFYGFAKDNPKLMTAPINESYKADITPLGEAIKKLAMAKYGDKDAIVAALKEARIVGKDEQDVAGALLRKRMLPRFKAEYRRYAEAVLQREVGPTAYKEILLHDAHLAAVARKLKRF